MPVTVLQRSLVEGALLGGLLRQPPSVSRLPVGLMTPEEAAAELGRVQARKAMDAAYEAELVMALAAARPDTDDPPPGHPGSRRRGGGSPVPGTSEFLPDELALVLNCARPYATGVLSDAFHVAERMPAVLAECSAGRLDWFRARVFADVLGSATDEVVATVVPAVLPVAAGLSSGRLRTRLVAAAIAADEEFAERRRVEAQRRAAVRVYSTADGMSVLASELPAAVAAAMWSTIDQAAHVVRTCGDDRPIGVLRAEAHAAMVLQPGDPTRPAMTGHLTVVAPLTALHPPAHTAPPDPVDPADPVDRAEPGDRVARAATALSTTPADHPPDLAAPVEPAGIANPATSADSTTSGIPLTSRPRRRRQSPSTSQPRRRSPTARTWRNVRPPVKAYRR